MVKKVDAMTPRMTESEFHAYQARQFHHHESAKTDNAVDKESDLHEAILADCRRRGWHAIHSRMDLPTTTGVGDPDFVILADLGKVYLVECKSKNGKLTTAQLALQTQAEVLGHTIHVVRSIQEYHDILKT